MYRTSSPCRPKLVMLVAASDLLTRKMSLPEVPKFDEAATVFGSTNLAVTKSALTAPMASFRAFSSVVRTVALSR
jgi:hypothetical protein